MQIISGKFRGKKLLWSSDSVTRPTTSRVKAGIFNVLTSQRGRADFENTRVLSLFGGSGQMGVECISRGATEVLFNDTDVAAREVILKNCKSVRHTPVICALDYMDCLKKLRGKQFDVVFLDPPFADVEASTKAVRFLHENGMISPDGVIVVEAEAQDLTFEHFEVKRKQYGRAAVYFLSLENGDEHRANRYRK